MSFFNEIRVEKDDEGKVIVYGPAKYAAIEGLFDNLGMSQDTWKGALDSLAANDGKSWSVYGDDYAAKIEGQEVVFFSQFNDRETVRVAKNDAKQLFERFLSLSAQQALS
jgi:hypothetical protein